MKQANRSSLSPGQHELWVNHELFNDVPTHSISFTARIEGNLQIDVLQKSVEHVDREFEGMRIRVGVENNSPVQWISDEGSAELDIHDLRSVDRAEEQALQLIDSRLAIPLDVYGKALHQFLLIQCPNNLFFFTIRFHHIINDGWGVYLFLREVKNTYRTLLEQKPPPLSPDSSYFQMVSKQGAYLKSDSFISDLAYWKQTLSGHDGYASYESANERKKGLLNEKRFVAPIDKTVLEDGYRFAETNKVSIQDVFLAILYLIARRRHGKNDQIIGMPTLGRSGRIEKNQLGMFAEMQPVRIHVEPESTTFWDLAKQIRRQLMQNYRAHRVPFREIYKQSDAIHSGHDLFEMVYSPQKQNYDPDFGEATGEIIVNNYGLQLAPLSVYVCELGPKQSYKLDITYHQAHYSNREIEYLSKQVLCLLENLEENKNRFVGDIEILPPAERELALQSVLKRKISSPDHSICSLFTQIANAYGSKKAVTFDDSTLSYKELDELSSRAAKFLVDRGLKGKPIAVMVERTVHLPVLLLGILKAGASYFPIDSRYPPSRISFMLNDAQVQSVIADSENLERLNGLELTIFQPEALLTYSSMKAVLPEVNPNETAYIIYTSGSTGQPKGVQISHHNVVRLMTSCDALFDFEASDVWALYHSYAFDFSVWEIFGALLHGARLLIVSNRIALDPEAFCKLISDEGVTILSQTPSAFQFLVPEFTKRACKEKLRYVVFGGEKLGKPHLKEWLDVFGDEEPKLINMYGITETTVHVTWHRIDKNEFCENSTSSLIGKPLDDLDLLLVNDQNELSPIGHVGEIWIGGGGLCQGYLNRPELNAEKFVPHPFKENEFMYRSGDLARLNDNGLLEYVGRKDNQVQIRGFRVEIGEVESALAACDGVEKTCVLAQNNGEIELVAYVKPKSGLAINETAIRHFLRQRLPEYMIPSNLFLLEHWPLTVNGKLDFKALPFQKTSIEKGNVLTETIDSTSSQILRAWEQVLEISEINPDANFFDLGGNSLKMISVQRLLRERLSEPIQLLDLYRFPTVRKLSEYLRVKESQGIGAVRERKEQPKKQTGGRSLAARIRNRRVFN